MPTAKDGVAALRATVINPLTNEKHLDGLIAAIRAAGQRALARNPAGAGGAVARPEALRRAWRTPSAFILARRTLRPAASRAASTTESPEAQRRPIRSDRFASPHPPHPAIR